MPVEHTTFPQALSLGVHEFRTPLSVGLGYLRMLIKEQGGPLSEKQRKMLQEVEKSYVRLSGLVDEMSDLRKLVSGQIAMGRQSFDLSAVVAELAGDMHEGDDRSVRVEFRGSEQPLLVTGDRARLTAAVKVLLQLVVRERARGVVVARCSAVDSGQPAALVVIGEEPQLPALAEAAASGRLVGEWKEGTGFGLPIARRVVEAHGGTLSSAPGDKDDQPRAGLAMQIPLNTSQV